MNNKFILFVALTYACPAYGLPSLEPFTPPIIKFTPTFNLPDPLPAPTPKPYTVEDCRAQILVTIDSVPDDFPGKTVEIFQNTCEKLASLCRKIPPNFSMPLPDNPEVICSRNDCFDFVQGTCGYVPYPPPINPAGLCHYEGISSGPECVEESS